MLGNAEYASGGNLRDVARFTPRNERLAIDAEIDRVVAFHRENLFPIHGIAGRSH